jgi:hypothetical protein
MKKEGTRGTGKIKGWKVRLFLRLADDANERLRALTRYHGDLSQYIDEALTSTDLRTLVVSSAKATKDSPGITAVISGDANMNLRAAARERGCSITALANSALHKWLERRNT